ncbi:inverse autotransporter beta domain-containing protein [Campylobacter fetus]|uniref:inverse autotransporter beta domain-containing protein n=1 Tax=Campylobacter fetus TaxID=196 RepID=UPI0003E31841|nr:inverse autotransporter beta-barrel domain-containing protein [Campylobacter fetus]PHJ03414.1 hypothetical protein IW21_08815 [Campylobacter fetus subsp. venerealis]PHJ03915.1 hypothetical protein IW23_09000 [Campylobacter fetus subsp. venerealis]CDF65832.1 invasin, putative [Campylobacter fetus subsp. venerealis str. 84-112]
MIINLILLVTILVSTINGSNFIIYDDLGNNIENNPKEAIYQNKIENPKNPVDKITSSKPAKVKPKIIEKTEPEVLSTKLSVNKIVKIPSSTKSINLNKTNTQNSKTEQQAELEKTQQKSIEIAQTAYSLIQTEDKSNSIKSFAANYASGKINQGIKEFIDSYANGARSEISFRYDTKNHKMNGSGKVLVPYTSDDFVKTVFIQNGVGQFNNRWISHAGAGIRFFPDAKSYTDVGNLMFGFNSVYDYDLSRYHQRLSVGAEVMYKNLLLTGNLYERLTSWRNSKDFESGYVEERPANGYDIKVKFAIPDYERLALTAEYVPEPTQIDGEKVDITATVYSVEFETPVIIKVFGNNPDDISIDRTVIGENEFAKVIYKNLRPNTNVTFRIDGTGGVLTDKTTEFGTNASISVNEAGEAIIYVKGQDLANSNLKVFAKNSDPLVSEKSVNLNIKNYTADMTLPTWNSSLYGNHQNTIDYKENFKIKVSNLMPNTTVTWSATNGATPNATTSQVAKDGTTEMDFSSIDDFSIRDTDITIEYNKNESVKTSMTKKLNLYQYQLNLTTDKSEIIGDEQYVATLSGGKPGEPVTWTVTGDSQEISKEEVFDENGKAKYTAQGKSPFLSNINLSVQNPIGITKKEILVTNEVNFFENSFSNHHSVTLGEAVAGKTYKKTLTYKTSQWKYVYAIRIQGNLSIDKYDVGYLYVNNILYRSDNAMSGNYNTNINVYKEQTMASEQLTIINSCTDYFTDSDWTNGMNYSFANFKVTLYLR